MQGMQSGGHIGISIKNLSATLSDDSAYRSYVGQPGNYAHTSRILHGTSIDIFMTQKDSSTLVAFWPNGNNLAVIALTTPTGPNDSDKADFSRMLESVTWSQ
jgi:hypothetical protein